jgi:hypothetical protein
MLPAETNIKEAYANGMDAEQQFIQDLVRWNREFSSQRHFSPFLGAFRLFCIEMSMPSVFRNLERILWNFYLE